MVERLKVLCREQGLSIRRLEIAAGLGSNSISKWKRSSPSLASLTKIAFVLKMPVWELVKELTVEKS